MLAFIGYFGLLAFWVLFIGLAKYTWMILLATVALYLVLRFSKKDEFAFERSFVVGFSLLALEYGFFIVANWGHLGMH